MSEYNKKAFDRFFANKSNLEMLSELNKFKSININDKDTLLNTLKLTKSNVKNIYNNIKNSSYENSIIKINKNKLTLFSAKCNDNFETIHKGVLSTTTDLFINNKLHTSSFRGSLVQKYFDCNESNKYKRLIVFKNKYNLTLLNFTSDNYSGRKYFRYLMTKELFGDDYDLSKVSQNYAKYSGFYKDGTVGQEFINYFIEIYAYDRYNFFMNLVKKDYETNIPCTDTIQSLPYTYSIKYNCIENKYDEITENELWSNDYPPFDGIIYIDYTEGSSNSIAGSTCELSFDSSTHCRESAVETVIYIPEIYLAIIKNLYMNDGEHFTFNKDEVISTNSNQMIMFAKLESFINDNFINTSNQLLVGGAYNTYLSNKNKYISLK